MMQLPVCMYAGCSASAPFLGCVTVSRVAKVHHRMHVMKYKYIKYGTQLSVGEQKVSPCSAGG